MDFEGMSWLIASSRNIPDGVCIFVIGSIRIWFLKVLRMRRAFFWIQTFRDSPGKAV